MFKRNDYYYISVLVLALVAFVITEDAAIKNCAKPSKQTESKTGPQIKKVSTTVRLQKLRKELEKENISAYIILTDDEHQSEFTSDHDKRREYITGFAASVGTIAVVTTNSAAVWTDSRYFIQAEMQLDENWKLMKRGECETPSIAKWLADQLKPGERVSTDPKICLYDDWKHWSDELGKHNLTLIATKGNLIDRIWGAEDNRPPYQSKPLMIRDFKYSGVSWQDKVKLLRKDMKKAEVDALFVTALDEIAWTLNLRGFDVQFIPVFRSYLVIEESQISLYVPKEKVTEEVIVHLNANQSTQGDFVSLKDYDDIWTELEEIGKRSKRIGLPKIYSYAGGVSYLIHRSLPEDKIHLLVSPALIRKAKKNRQESEGMRNSHVRDGVALCQFLYEIENEITSGAAEWTELKAVSAVNDFRSKQSLSFGPSFGTTSAFGENAAIPHYQPTRDTDTIIDASKLYIIDSGGQYLDGSTDVARTVHFGQPTEAEKEVYTKLLMGCIDIISVTFKEGYDVTASERLATSRLNPIESHYGKGVTHGIGSFLSVPEAFNTTYHVDFFGSQKPGYYKRDHFGIRLGNVVNVVEANGTREEGNEKYLTFETVTLVPYERKLIDVKILDEKHVKWLNEYHEKIREIIGAEMLRQGLNQEYEWLKIKTKPIEL